MNQRQRESHVCHIICDGIHPAIVSPNLYHCKRNVGQTRYDTCVKVGLEQTPVNAAVSRISHGCGTWIRTR